jgi:hypothetical protein
MCSYLNHKSGCGKCVCPCLHEGGLLEHANYMQIISHIYTIIS